MALPENSPLRAGFADSALDGAAATPVRAGVVTPINANIRLLTAFSNEDLRQLAESMDGKPDDLLAFLFAQRAHMHKLEEATLIDGLTGIPNRAAFDKALSQAITTVNRQKIDQNYDKIEKPDQFLVIYFDLNKFKDINDTLGHAAGDVAIVAFAKALQKIMRSTDMCARLSGDEFAVILRDDAGNENFRHGAKKRFKKELIPFYFEYNGQEYPLTASYGAAQIKAGMSARAIKEEADKNMYGFKKRLGPERGLPLVPKPVSDVSGPDDSAQYGPT